MRILKLIFVLFFIWTCNLNGQTLPPIQVYTPEDYNADNQNWQISQSNDKHIYIANNRGLLEFDGSEWQLYNSPNNSIIRSVKVIGDRIYTGCYMDFGYWVKNSFGKLQYTSLLPLLDENIKEDEQIWHILELNEWVIFQSSHRILFYNTINNNFKIINSDKIIFNVFKIKETIYFTVRNEGVFIIKNGKPELVTSDSTIKNERIINVFNVNDELIYITQKAGFYKIENNKAVKWNIPSKNVIENTHIYCALQLSNGSLIFGTISNGIISINSNGTLNYQINQRNGLSNNTALDLFEDIDKNLWIGLDNGINCINVTSPIEVFNDFNGVLGTVYTSKVFKNHLYLGTNQGLFFKKVNTNDSFKFIEGTGGQVWNLYNYENENLLCGHHLGTFVIDVDKASLIDSNLGTWGFKKIHNRRNLILKGNYDGLYVLEKKTEKWVVRNKIEGFNSSSRFFELDKYNNIWVSHENKGVIKLTINNDFTKAVKVSLESSLKVGKNSSLVKYKDDILYASQDGVYKYDTTNASFKYDSILSPIINKENYISGKLVVENEDKLWSFNENNINYVTTNNITNKPKINSIAIPINLRKVTLSFENITQINNDIYLLGTANGYLTIDLPKINNHSEYSIFLNSIAFKNLASKEIKYDKEQLGEFKYEQGIITFDFSAPNYDKYLDVKYQYKLEGQNTSWSNWTNDSKARFENLGFGEYIFKVRAKVGNKFTNNTVTYRFIIQRPWYLSNITLFIYFLMFLLIVFITHKAYNRHYNKKLKNKQSENEKIIIQIKNEQLNQDIENKNRELTISKMSIIKKNELLNGIKKELKNHEHPKNIQSVIKLIDDNLNNTKDWDFFVKAFKNTDKGFLNKIKALHPKLTPNDVRFCVYLRLNLSSKEIADLLNISIKSVETRRYRLRKRMNLPHEKNLMDYILNL